MKNDRIKSDRIKTDRIQSITDPRGCRIFECMTFSGGVLLSDNTVNELCYVAQFVNSTGTVL
jgi:hypothetical protein